MLILPKCNARNVLINKELKSNWEPAIIYMRSV